MSFRNFAKRNNLDLYVTKQSVSVLPEPDQIEPDQITNLHTKVFTAVSAFNKAIGILENMPLLQEELQIAQEIMQKLDQFEERLSQYK